MKSTAAATTLLLTVAVLAAGCAGSENARRAEAGRCAGPLVAANPGRFAPTDAQQAAMRHLGRTVCDRG
jgi:hypothetical protein